MNSISILLGLSAALGVVLVVVGLRSSQATDAATLLRQRLIRQELGLGQSAIALELERPLSERLLEPVRKAVTRQMTRFTPAAQAASFQRELDFIGNPFGLDPAGVQTLRIAAAAGLAAVGIALGILLGSPIMIAVLLAGGLVLGFYFPILWLRQLVNGRRGELEAVLPNALDVVAISMEAGLGLDRALEQLVRHQEGPLTLLVARALREIELGRPRADALNDMAEATGVEDFAALVRSILHAERTGVPIARTIAAHSAQMRVKRRLKIRADASRASLKIMLPTVGCVFPTLWLILLGPALLVVLSISSH
jgi:tight adherence protein C